MIHNDIRTFIIEILPLWQVDPLSVAKVWHILLKDFSNYDDIPNETKNVLCLQLGHHKLELAIISKKLSNDLQNTIFDVPWKFSVNM